MHCPAQPCTRGTHRAPPRRLTSSRHTPHTAYRAPAQRLAAPVPRLVACTRGTHRVPPRRLGSSATCHRSPPRCLPQGPQRSEARAQEGGERSRTRAPGDCRVHRGPLVCSCSRQSHRASLRASSALLCLLQPLRPLRGTLNAWLSRNRCAPQSAGEQAITAATPVLTEAATELSKQATPFLQNTVDTAIKTIQALVNQGLEAAGPYAPRARLEPPSRGGGCACQCVKVERRADRAAQVCGRCGRRLGDRRRRRGGATRRDRAHSGRRRLQGAAAAVRPSALLTLTLTLTPTLTLTCAHRLSKPTRLVPPTTLHGLLAWRPPVAPLGTICSLRAHRRREAIRL